MTSHNKRTVTIWLLHSTPTCRKNKWDILKRGRDRGGQLWQRWMLFTLV